MKTHMLREETNVKLKKKLLDLLYEKFTLRMQNANNKTKNTYLIKKIRRNIARIKTILTEKSNGAYNE